MIEKLPKQTIEPGQDGQEILLALTIQKLNEVIDYLNERVNPDQHIWKTKIKRANSPSKEEGQDK